MAREKRTKKESLKKRESKGTVSLAENPRATPGPDLKYGDPPPAEISPMRYKLAPPKSTDFDPPRGPVFTSHHSVQDPDGREIEFFEASEQ
jgi:COMPASS component BRE2